jgi:hypothetical protein
MVVQANGCPNRRVVGLEHTAYVPLFHVSVASLRLFIKKDVHWDTMNNQLTYGPDRLHFAKTPMVLSQWVLDYRPVGSSQESPVLNSPALTPTLFSAHSSRHPRPVNA